MWPARFNREFFVRGSSPANNPLMIDMLQGSSDTFGMQTARHWHLLDDTRIQCDLCPHACRLMEGGRGRCKVRGVNNGQLMALAHGSVSSIAMDPIEKKPLYHFYPGSQIFSIGGWGCNLSCTCCQNWSIAQEFEIGQTFEPADVLEQASQNDSIGIAYTYNEPLIGYEFVDACARLARERGLQNVLVTNGFVCSTPAAELLPFIDALNIDIKSMDASFYEAYCQGRLAPVLDFAQQAHAAGCHVEITNLLIPGLNDSEQHVRRLATWIRDTLGPTIPLHLSAYRPEYKMRIPATSPSGVLAAYGWCKALLNHVYVGNLSVATGQDTICPDCGAILIKRVGYRTRPEQIAQGACRNCGRRMAIRM